METIGSITTDKAASQADKVREITDKLEQGIKDLFESDRYMNYLKIMSRFHNYSFNNSLLIAMQNRMQLMLLAIHHGRRTLTDMYRRGKRVFVSLLLLHTK